MSLEIIERSLPRGLAKKQFPMKNVRELENGIERAVVLCRGDAISPDLLPDTIRQKINPFMIAEENVPFKDKVDRYRKLLIMDALQKANGVQKEAAGVLRIKPTTLNEMIKRYNIKAMA